MRNVRPLEDSKERFALIALTVVFARLEITHAVVIVSSSQSLYRALKAKRIIKPNSKMFTER